MTETQDILPAETAGTEITRFNALKHGVLSRYTVLPWEDADEYRVLASSLADEHRPQGPTEEHLVEELAGILWRKRRLRLAEAAAHQHGLEDATKPHRGTVKAALVHLDSGKQVERVVDAIRATPEKTAEESRDLNEDESMTATAVAILDAGKPKAYEHAVAALLADTREWWEDVLLRDPEDFDEGETPFTPDADGLRRFIERDLRPWYVQRRKELENRPLIRAQAFGQSLDPDKLSRLARYEVRRQRAHPLGRQGPGRRSDIRREQPERRVPGEAVRLQLRFPRLLGRRAEPGGVYVAAAVNQMRAQPVDRTRQTATNPCRSSTVLAGVNSARICAGDSASVARIVVASHFQDDDDDAIWIRASVDGRCGRAGFVDRAGAGGWR